MIESQRCQMSKKDAAQFWTLASRYLNHHLKSIRQLSSHTIESYRSSLNQYIFYLEKKESINRKNITFNNFDKKTLIKYQEWMVKEKKLSPKTCNLRMTSIRSFLEYAAQEEVWITPLYNDARNIVNVKVTNHPIEYFEADELTALLNAPEIHKRSERRNQMIFILMYDTAARVSEIRHIRLSDLHLNAKIPYITLLGKGRKYRNVPLMEKTIDHLKNYLKEFHDININRDQPLFYSKIHNRLYELSSDTLEKAIKKYADICRSKGQSMPENVHCHMIRKTRAMNLYHEGVPLTHIQQLLGHENISTTSGFYAFATLEALANAMGKIKSDEGVKDWHDEDVLNKLYKL